MAEEIAGPFGLDFGFGLGPAAIARCAELEYDAPDWPVRERGRARFGHGPGGRRTRPAPATSPW